MVTTCAAKSAWNPGNTPNKDSLGGGLMGGVFMASIAIELDREHFRKFCETETEFVRNSKVLVDFEVRT